MCCVIEFHNVNTIFDRVQTLLNGLKNKLNNSFFPTTRIIKSINDTVNPVDKWCTRVVITICCLGPGHRPPSVTRVRYILNLLEDLRHSDTIDIQNLTGIEQVVIAYGCGWMRNMLPDSPVSIPSWQNRWHYAFLAFRERVLRPQIIRVFRWLNRMYFSGYMRVNVRDYFITGNIATELADWMLDPVAVIIDIQKLSAKIEADNLEICINDKLFCSLTTGQRFAFSLAQDTTAQFYDDKDKEVGHLRLSAHKKCFLTKPPEDGYLLSYAGYTRPVIRQQQMILDYDGKIDIWSCLCGWSNCQTRHQLKNWDPKTETLMSWSKKAVMGQYLANNGTVPKLKSFIENSMSYAYLAYGEHSFYADIPSLWKLTVELTFCITCQKFFAGIQCSCGAKISNNINKLDIKNERAELVTIQGGEIFGYEAHKWRTVPRNPGCKIKNCYKYFPVKLKTCECGNTLTNTLTTLWRRTDNGLQLLPIILPQSSVIDETEDTE